MNHLVDHLEQRGYVERVPDPADRRAKLIRLTDKGKLAQGVGQKLFGEIEKRLGEQYGPERVAELRALLEQLAAEKAPNAVPNPVRLEAAAS